MNNKKHTNLLQEYLDGNISHHDYIRNFKDLHAESVCEKSMILMDQVDPRLVKLYEKCKVRLETLAGLQLEGVFNSFASDEKDGCELKHYHISLRYGHYAKMQLNTGSCVSCGSGGKDNGETWYVDNKDRFSITFEMPTCHYLAAEADDISEVTPEDVVDSAVQAFYDREGYYFYKDNKDKMTDQEIVNKIYPDNFTLV